jgi:hypothetical protein
VLERVCSDFIVMIPFDLLNDELTNGHSLATRLWQVEPQTRNTWVRDPLGAYSVSDLRIL